MSADARTAELAANLADVHERIAAAANSCGRDPAEVALIVVTKTWPAADVRRLAGLGVADVGENRDQEASAKYAECADLALRWHFVGGLQRNKCRSVAHYASVVHSVDRPELVTALGSAARAAGRDLEVCLQVSLDGAPGREGAQPEELEALALAVEAEHGLRLRGLMAVAPLGVDPEPPFSLLQQLATRLRQAHPEATMLSAGMSHDLEAAIRHGATHVRVGTAVLGHRPRLG